MRATRTYTYKWHADSGQWVIWLSSRYGNPPLVVDACDTLAEAAAYCRQMNNKQAEYDARMGA